MSDDRFREAELLHTNGFHSGAYYLSGYAVEYGLKAVICKRLNIEMFERKIVPGEVAKAFQIHDIEYLIILAGLHQDLEDLKSDDAAFAKAWSLVSEWSEQRRYDYGCKPETAGRFLQAVKAVMVWIQKNW